MCEESEGEYRRRSGQVREKRRYSIDSLREILRDAGIRAGQVRDRLGYGWRPKMAGGGACAASVNGADPSWFVLLLIRRSLVRAQVGEPEYIKKPSPFGRAFCFSANEFSIRKRPFE